MKIQLMINPIKTALMFSIVLTLSFGAVANISHGAELDAYGGFTDIKGGGVTFFLYFRFVDIAAF